jgi:hypothetical protein
MLHVRIGAGCNHCLYRGSIVRAARRVSLSKRRQLTVAFVAGAVGGGKNRCHQTADSFRTSARSFLREPPDLQVRLMPSR